MQTLTRKHLPKNNGTGRFGNRLVYSGDHVKDKLKELRTETKLQIQLVL